MRVSLGVRDPRCGLGLGMFAVRSSGLGRELTLVGGVLVGTFGDRDRGRD
jgi:hypothetical protein